MQVSHRATGLHVTIMPGEFYVTDREVTIGTLLGSCVAACLYDPANKVIGMNHFLLSNRRYTQNLPVCLSEAGRYGIHAMELLINEMLKSGAKRGNLRAKAFGGASISLAQQLKDNFYCVGDVNTRFIREFLKNDGIPLLAEDLGGEIGRVIHFMQKDFSIRMKRIGMTRVSSLIPNEKQYWRRAIDTQETSKIQAEVWG